MNSRRLVRLLPIALTIAVTGGIVLAQDEEGSSPAVSAGDGSGSYEVSGVNVDVTGKTADAARTGGWRIAQRKGWQMLSQRLGGDGSLVSDGTLDSLVSGIVVENEQIGPNRYVARLGVLFSRARAGALLGVAGRTMRSAPMLTIPIEWSGGAGPAFEQKTQWQEAWNRYRTGNSAIDYVRPAGSGPDSLLLNAGQVGRPGRAWWRTILDQYGASDVLVPMVRLSRQWPGGPIIGVFEARHGPDNHIIARFTLRVGNGDALPVLLDAGVKRIDDAYQAALRNGTLRTDPTLSSRPPEPTPVVEEEAPGESAVETNDAVQISGGVAINIQVDTPGAASVSATEAALRNIPGVRSALTTSLALGGVSVMRVSFDGDPATLRPLLEARGWAVQGTGTTLRIRRAGAPSQGVTAPPAENATSG
ncbi:heavy-metal-associated domain-containing protein [Sphingomonas sp. QA11]|uniref:heavy-metal-associated domain-containing protein n=1 Tax=Sphingomonas sp. QA11 TaxID=2950605 RepID=UPI00234930AC|nr:heavy-metal-associated domain-containing protein [Sphingomonas sp. QA11]WCM28853.1 heavy-metal-associated domain-containing protein [Sphingomonas sp. QA11]